MDIPIGEPLQLPVQVVNTSRMPPAVLRGTLTGYDGAHYDVRLESEARGVGPGDVVVLDLDRPDAPLIQARVESGAGLDLRLQEERTRPREPREFPRVVGDLTVRYCVAPGSLDEPALAAWVKDGTLPAQVGPWRQPSRLVDWSASGLGFEDGAACQAGDCLLLEIAAGAGAAAHRAVGRVLRVSGPTSAQLVAVDLERLSAEARERLLEETIDRQHLPGEDPDPDA